MMENRSTIVLSLILSLTLSLAFVSGQASLKSLPLQDCPKGVVQCGYSERGTSAIRECADGYDWTTKEDCGTYGTCTYNSDANPICERVEQEASSIKIDNRSDNAPFVVGGAIIIGFIILAVAIGKRNKNGEKSS